MKTKYYFTLTCLLATALLPALTGEAQPTVTKLAAGGYHSLFIKSDGSLWSMGDNSYGQLGDGTTSTHYFPTEIVSSGVIAIAAGRNHSLFIKRHGNVFHTTTELWAMGDNTYGQLGDGTTNNHATPVLIESYTTPQLSGTSPVIAIAAGGAHSLFIKGDGSLWAMGENQFGQLGDGTLTSRNVPEKIVGAGITAIAAGSGHSLFVRSDTSLWAMGNNASGQLGDNTANPFFYFQEQIVASGVTAVAAGGSHSLFLKTDGSLWAMGQNHDGELGDGTTNNINHPEQIVASGVTAIAAGGGINLIGSGNSAAEGHSLFLKSDGSLWAMGLNYFGQLGDWNYQDFYDYDEYGNIVDIYSIGINAKRPERVVFSSVAAIAAGGAHSLFTMGDGSLWGMGYYWDYGAIPAQGVATVPPGPYNQISIQNLAGGSVGLSFAGDTNLNNYALDRSFSLAPANWVPQVTNTTGASGELLFTNTPDRTTNNFWRIRSVP